MYRLVLSSAHLSLETFLSEFPRLLHLCSVDSVALSNDSESSSSGNGGSTAEGGAVTVISSARVPLVKWRFEDRVDVDITFARVFSSQPPTAGEILSLGFLQKVSVETRSHVYGIRTCLQIHHLICCNGIPLSCFSDALRTAREWAIKRCAYNNLFTFPNGVVLSIMMAKVCLQLAEHSTDRRLSEPSFSSILREFFSYFSSLLSQTPPPYAPIFLTQTLNAPPGAPRVIPGLPPCWMPRPLTSNEELFPVINPAFPYANSARFIGRTGLKYLTEELQRAHHCIQHCSQTKSPDFINSSCLTFLFQPFSFPPKFTFFVSVNFSCVGSTAIFSEPQVEELFQQWKGYLQSKIRIFIYSLECVLDARPYPHVIPSSATSAIHENEEQYSQSVALEGHTSDALEFKFKQHENSIASGAVTGESKSNFDSDNYITKEGSFWLGIETISAVDFEKKDLSVILSKAFHYFDNAWRSGCITSICNPNSRPKSFPGCPSSQDAKHAGSSFTRFENVMLEPWWSLHDREEAAYFLPLSES